MATAAAAVLEGELSFARVPQWLAQAATLSASDTLDLSRVTRADSAGLALLLELTRRAKARGAVLKLHGAPDQVVDLARFFGLQSILGFDR